MYPKSDQASIEVQTYGGPHLVVCIIAMVTGWMLRQLVLEVGKGGFKDFV